jgi:glutamyl/glutaminyl-tRNA synthetase
MKKVRFAPSPTGSLHIGNALVKRLRAELGADRDGTLRRPDASL